MDVVQLRPRLWRWSLPHPDWEPDDAEGGEGWQQEVASYALVAEDELVLFDPLVPPAGTEDAQRFWHALDDDVHHHGPPRILITIHWHCRSAQEILDHYDGTRVFVGEGRVNRIFWIQSHRALLFGDVILGAEGGGARLCPPGWYAPEPREKLIETLRPLLDLPVEALLLTHGDPVLDDAREALEHALQAP
jgi:glyoxylase-like metal-dependent hydrolase (beta-lactamase superfamily II)